MSEQSETQKIKSVSKKDYKSLERVTIDEDLKEKLISLTRLANESLQGMASITKSDIVNLFIRLHSDVLSKAESEELKKMYFDIFKCLSWLQNQAKLAKERGDEVTLKELFERSSGLMATAKSPIKKIRKPRVVDGLDKVISTQTDPLERSCEI